MDIVIPEYIILAIVVALTVFIRHHRGAWRKQELIGDTSSWLNYNHSGKFLPDANNHTRRQLHHMHESTNVTSGAQSGDWVTTERLLPKVYDELRRLAASYLAREQFGQTRRPTSLVHEAYLKLIGLDAKTLWRDERHFFGAAAIAIRRILVDNARYKRALKRGGGATQQILHDELAATLPEPVEDLIALDEALNKLASVHPEAAEIVQLVYFSGLTLRQAAEVLSISPRSADRLWTYAKAWLRRELRDEEKS